jgi:protein phosphatase
MTDISAAAKQVASRVASRSSRPSSPLVHLDVSAVSHAGHVRSNNEDQFFVTKATRSLQTMLTSLPDGDVPERAEEVNYVMVVTDGMGGHAGGEVASRLAISALVGIALEIPDWIFRADEKHVPEMQRRMRQAVQQVSAIVTERGREDSALRGMGSTLTAARICGRDMLIVHVGDSRAYLFRAGHLKRLTRDHTYAQLLIDTGQASPGDATLSRLRHILTNALGGSDAHVEVDIDLVRLEDGDRLLLCSDGLTDCVDDDTIAATLDEAPASKEACARLLQRALDCEARDNVTAIVGAFGFSAPPQSP